MSRSIDARMTNDQGRFMLDGVVGRCRSDKIGIGKFQLRAGHGDVAAGLEYLDGGIGSHGRQFPATGGGE